MRAPRFPLRVLISVEHDRFVALGLEHRICATHQDILGLRLNLERVVRSCVAESKWLGISALSDVPRAPDLAFEEWDRAKGAIEIFPVGPVVMLMRQYD